MKSSITKPSNDVNRVLADGTLVRSKSDGRIGTIERFGHTFGFGDKAYNAYFVRWSNGNLGYPNESDFEVVG